MTFFGKIGLLLFVVIIPAIIWWLTSSVVTALIFAIMLGIFYLALSVKIIIEYDRGLLFILGRFRGVLSPGFNIIFPGVEQIIRVSLRVQVADAPQQEIITKDNIPLNINAVAYYKVKDPMAAVLNVENYKLATFQIAQTTIRSVVGQHEMDEILSQRDKINEILRRTIDKDTDAWGIEIELVELKDVELPQNLKRAMAKQAEAERERRARIILATGEYEASEKLADAGKMMASEAGALQIRLLQTLQEISAEKNSTILFPFPIELLTLFHGKDQR